MLARQERSSVLRLNPHHESDERDNSQNADRMLAIQLSDFDNQAFS